MINTPIQKLMDCLSEAECLLQPYADLSEPAKKQGPDSRVDAEVATRILERLSESIEFDATVDSSIRIIQHLSCSGGTLIAKCVSAMPSVSLLSEVYPASPLTNVHRTGFAPTDVAYQAKLGNFPMMDGLSEKIFKSSITTVAKHLQSLGRYLVIREHTHSGYLLERLPEKISSVRAILKESYPLVSILTVRHPVDCYLSLLKNEWVEFVPATFNEYCNRHLRFLKNNDGIPVFKYENFVEQPYQQMQEICQSLELPFNKDFLDFFDIHQLSGDSGRSSNIIEHRDRHDYSKQFKDDVLKSKSYQEICEQLGYESEIE